MLSWVDKMVPEYIEGRQEMKKRANQVDRSNPIEMNDLKQFNSMIDSMTYSLEWMTNGRQPNTYRGGDEKAVYQRRSYENIDLIPDIAVQLKDESDNDKKHLFMTRENYTSGYSFFFFVEGAAVLYITHGTRYELVGNSR